MASSWATIRVPVGSHERADAVGDDDLSVDSRLLRDGGREAPFPERVGGGRAERTVPVAVLGTDAFDVAQVDVETIQISRTDGVGGSAAPIRSSYEDVGTPFEGEPCDCHELEGDGLDDLTLKFSSQEVMVALELDALQGGDFVELVVSGNLLDGTPFSGSDCIRLVPPHNAMADPPSASPGIAGANR